MTAQVADPDYSARREQLERRLDELRDARLDVAERQREAEFMRATAAADDEELKATTQGRRERMTVAVEQAERASLNADVYDKDKAEERWSEAREALMEFDVRAAEDAAARRRTYSDLDSRVTAFNSEANELDRQIGSVSEELARLVSSDQADRARELEAQLEELAPLVDAQREAVGMSATADLAEDYAGQADTHATAWKWWGAGLLVAVAGAVAGGLLLFQQDSVPSGKLTNGAVVEVARNLVIVGLLIYLVRLAALQFRVHRHLEAVARNKATALSTFNRMVGVASEPEIRNSLATVLAQCVFASDETGFVGTDSDHITLIERFASGVPKPG